ncbi:MAG: F0F1 ATP synthase subunit A [Erysipelotrichaceae bacterium]
MSDTFDGIVLTIGSIKIPIQQSILVWLILCVIFAILFIVVGKKFQKADPSETPHGVLLLAEIVYNMAISIIGDNLGQRTKKFLPFFGTLILMMGVSNLCGLLGVQPPTSNLSVTATFGLMMFVLIQYTAIKEQSLKGRLKGLLEPVAALAPLNVIGELALPLSLAFRLFGNILGGTIIVSLIYSVIKMIAGMFLPLIGLGYIVTPFVHCYFDIFSGLMQTYIFFTLSSYFLGDVTVQD